MLCEQLSTFVIVTAEKKCVWFKAVVILFLAAAKLRMSEDQEQFGKATFKMTGMDRLYR